MIRVQKDKDGIRFIEAKLNISVYADLEEGELRDEITEEEANKLIKEAQYNFGNAMEEIANADFELVGKIKGEMIPNVEGGTTFKPDEPLDDVQIANL